jgi:cytochrome P450
MFSSAGNFALQDETGGPSLPPILMITMMDPPEHTALRSRLRRWFSPGKLRSHGTRVREIVTRILSDFAPGEEIEFFAMVARKVPARTVYALLGLPEHDWDRLQNWADAINDRLPQVPPDLPEARALMAYIGDLLACGPRRRRRVRT